MFHCYDLNDLEEFYQKNKEYLLFLYFTEDEFINTITNYKQQNQDEDEKYCNLIIDNVKASQDKYTEDDCEKLFHLMKEQNKCSTLKEFNKLDRKIKALNEKIYKKRNFIKQFFLTLEC